MHGSQLKSYSYGIAAEHKEMNSRLLEVTPMETLPALDGELAFNPVETVVKGTDGQGTTYEDRTNTASSLSAEWLPMGTNRVTPPDIRRGEAVEILRLGDTDRFFWRVLGTHDHLRRLETVIWAFNGSPNEEGNGVNINNCYYVEVSTHTGQITIGTSKANGEPFAFTIQINTKDGEFHIQDDVGNFFELISKLSSIKAENADGSKVHLNKKTIEMDAPKQIKLTVGGSTISIDPALIAVTAAAIAFKQG